MKVNIREFKHIVRNIIKEEMEKVDEITGSNIDFEIATQDIESRFSKSGEDIENPKNKSFKKSKIPMSIPMSLINKIKEFFGYEGYEVSDEKIKEKLEELNPKKS